MPKRKLDEVEAEDGEERENTLSEDSNSSVHTNSSTDVPTAETSNGATGGFTHMDQDPNRRVKFKGVTVFYFQRKQGFVCVPSQGGSTLGMGEEHMTADSFSIREFARHQRQLHLDILAQQRGAKMVGMDGLRSPGTTDGSTGSSNGDSESSLSSDEELNVDDYYFLQPVPTRQRRLMLRQAGIKKIDTLEKEECKDIRSSRESCGCDCRVYCEPETCACSLAGIKCQVDRLSFPCGCSKDGCGNLSGRIEFNPIRVRTHFIHTLMRLEMDKKQEEETALRKQRHGEQGPTRAESSPVCPELVTDPDPPGPSTLHDSGDVPLYNSNERGSCCDCQNSDIHKFMMHESQFNGPANAAGNSLQPTVGVSNAEYHTATGNGGVEPTGGNLSNKPGEKASPQVLLFNDSDDEYSGENSATLYPFTKEDSSYSESSDCSSDASGSENDHTTAVASFANFQGDNPTYDTTSVVDTVHSSSFCVSSASTALPDQKFLDLADPGGSYKLEPISEILNPVRFPGYGSGPVNAAWTSGGEPYPNFPCAEVTNGHVSATSSPYSEPGVAPKSQSEYVSYAVDTSGAGLSPVLPPTSAQLPEQYLEPAYDVCVPDPVNGHVHTKADDLHLHHDESNKKSYHDLSTSSLATAQNTEAMPSANPIPDHSPANGQKESLSGLLPSHDKHKKVALESGVLIQDPSLESSSSNAVSVNGDANPCEEFAPKRCEVNKSVMAVETPSPDTSRIAPAEDSALLHHLPPGGQSQNEAASKCNGVRELSCGGEEKMTGIREAGSTSSKFEEMVTDSLETLSA